MYRQRMCFSHHGVEAIGKMPSHPGGGSVFTAKFFNLLLGLMEHLYTLDIPLRQLVQLQHTHTQSELLKL